MAHVYQYYEDSEHTEAFIVASYKKHNVESSKIQWAAIIIQSFFKGIYVRQQIKKMHKAANIIQSYVRGWFVRYRLPDIMHEYYDRTCLKHYNDAAVIIQSRWKGFIVRMYEICIKDILKMKANALKANDAIQKLFQRRFSEMGLDDLQSNTRHAHKVFQVLLDRHHLLRTNKTQGVLSKSGTNELSELEKLLKSMPWKDYMNEVHKIYYQFYDENPPYKYKFKDQRLRKQEDLLRHRNEVEYEHRYDKGRQTDPTSSNVLREKAFSLNTKIKEKKYERLLCTTGKYVKQKNNIARTIDPSKNISKTDFHFGVFRDLALKSNIPPYYINFWFDKCSCNQHDL